MCSYTVEPSPNKKIVIGITGSFGSGKTTVAGIFKSLGASIIDADSIGHQIILRGSRVYKKIIFVFGKVVLKANKNIDRSKLSRIVFNNKNYLHRLNKIMHPEIIRIMKNKIKKTRSKIIVMDTPLLLEAGLGGLVEKLIVVSASRKTQIARVQKKTGLSRKDIVKRINAQLPLSYKIRRADFVIDNNASLENTRRQVKQIRRLLWKN